MRFAINLPNFGSFADAAVVADLAAIAEEAGWDGFFVWDHIAVAEGIPVGDPFVILTAVAMRTEQITIGTMVTPLPRRRPWVLARQCTTLDHLSRGRLVLGVGIGFPPGPEFGIFGEPTEDRMRGAMLDEGLAVLEVMWSGAPGGYAGEHYSLAPWSFAPRPLQEPRIPIWVAGTWPNRSPFRRAARYEGVFPLASVDGVPSPITDTDLAESLDFVAGERGNLQSYEVAAHVALTGDPVADRDRADAMAALGVTWAHVAPHPEGESPDMIERWVAGGPPR